MSRSKSACSAAVRKPKRASVSSRTWVWVRRVTSCAGLAEAVEGAEGDGDAVADAADVDDRLLGLLAQEPAAQLRDHAAAPAAGAGAGSAQAEGDGEGVGRVAGLGLAGQRQEPRRP